MALIVGGTTFSGSYNNLSDKPTIPTNTNQLTNGAGYITSAPAPTSSQVASATAGISAGSVGSYAMIRDLSGNERNTGATISGSQLRYCSAASNYGTTPSGTWRIMGYILPGNESYGDGTTTCLRIS